MINGDGIDAQDVNFRTFCKMVIEIEKQKARIKELEQEAVRPPLTDACPTCCTNLWVSCVATEEDKVRLHGKWVICQQCQVVKWNKALREELEKAEAELEQLRPRVHDRDDWREVALRNQKRTEEAEEQLGRQTTMRRIAEAGMRGALEAQEDAEAQRDAALKVCREYGGHQKRECTYGRITEGGCICGWDKARAKVLGDDTPQPKTTECPRCHGNLLIPRDKDYIDCIVCPTCDGKRTVKI